jgi:hypothetical protein
MSGRRERSGRLSHQMLANATGISKSAVQTAMGQLLATAIPEYRIARSRLSR